MAHLAFLLFLSHFLFQASTESNLPQRPFKMLWRLMNTSRGRITSHRIRSCLLRAHLCPGKVWLSGPPPKLIHHPWREGCHLILFRSTDPVGVVALSTALFLTFHTFSFIDWMDAKKRGSAVFKRHCLQSRENKVDGR